jgi:hypothetical protein
VSGCRHVALFVFRDDATEDQIAAVATGLAALPAQIPEIGTYRIGPDLGINDGSYDYAVIADFANVEDYLVYRDHPVHQALLADTIRPILASRAAVQYDI